VTTASLFHACHRHYPGGTPGCPLRSLPQQYQPSPYFGRVGFRITLFEACSAFTHITACMLAESLTGPSTPEASTASLPPQLLQLLPAEAKVAGRDLHPLRDSALSRRTEMFGLKAIAASLGTARDWDVTVVELIRPVVDAHPDDQRLARLAQETALQRDAARVRCMRAVNDHTHHRVLAELRAYLNCEWPSADQESAPSLEAFALQRLDWLHRKVDKAAKGATADDVPTLHRLRIAIKRLRYSLEFFGPLLIRADLRRYLDRMKALQEDLGRLNDLANAYPRLAQCAAENPSIAEGVAFAHGWYSHQLGELLRRIPGEIEQLAKLRRFWRS
jgi:CHAD domain-containing protein